MEKSKANHASDFHTTNKDFTMTPDEKKRLVDFFSLLLEIDQRENVTKTYGNKQSHKRSADSSY